MKGDYRLDAMLRFTPLFRVAAVALLALAFLFPSVLPTSALTFKEECGPGYWVPHQ